MINHESDGSAPGEELHQTPRHVAIIMDGNGRWARRRGLPRIAGHEAGTENIRRITSRAAELGIEYLTLWAFSTENWRRPEDEVQGILSILAAAIDSETEDLHRQGARLVHIGSLDGLPPELAQSVLDAVELTRHNQRIQLTLAFNYGGRSEILHAIQRLLRERISPDALSEALFDQYLYTDGMPDPDLIVRTSGEMRTSNFLIWQAAFAEYHFTQTLWPDFGPDDLDIAVTDYISRERRFGGLLDEPSPQPMQI